jgi:hypothetical protein
MGSEFDDWVYWHFFTITADSNSSHTELLLKDVCLTNLSEESLTNLGLTSTFTQSLEFTNPLPFVTAREPNMSTASKGSILCFTYALSRKPCINSGQRFDSPPSVFVAAKHVLTIRYLAMDYFVTILKWILESKDQMV